MIRSHLVYILFLLCTLWDRALSSPFDRIKNLPATGNRSSPEMVRSLRSKDKQKRLEDIRDKIIRGLNIPPAHKAPINRTDPPAGWVADIMRKGPDRDVNLNTPTTTAASSTDSAAIDKDVFTFAEKSTVCGADDVVQFRINGVNSDQHVTRANLKLLVRYKKRKKSKNPSRIVEIKIYHLAPDAGPKESGASRQPEAITRLRVTVRHTKWQTLFLPTSIVQRVLDSPQKVLCVKIECKDCGNGIDPVLVNRKRAAKSKPAVEKEKSKRRKRKSRTRRGPSQGSKPRPNRKIRLSKRRPYLLLQTRRKDDDLVRNIKKRAIPRCANRGSQPCEVSPLFVDFADLGWSEWIVSPKGYQANFCGGSCLQEEEASYRLPQRFQNDQYDKSTPNSQAGHCCREKVTRPLQLLHFDDVNSLVMTELPNMIIDECECV